MVLIEVEVEAGLQAVTVVDMRGEVAVVHRRVDSEAVENREGELLVH